MDEAERVGRAALAGGWQVGVAESLTGGHLTAAFAAASDSSTWFAGGLVAYESEVKFRVLGVTRGPVVSARCAEEMAEGARRLLGVDVAVAATGAGGPGPQDGRPAGTVHLAVASAERTTSVERHFDGDPPAVIDQAVLAAVRLVEAALAGAGPTEED